ncbi:MAG: aspartate--tRNA ligase [Elusimicrobia bacterium]|nr:aspartate--tRNA ligase [Elusimicrobiota bacterium]
MMRTHTCGELNSSHIGQKAVLCGWADSKRNHGGVLFINLRDLYGITQITVNPENPFFQTAEKIKNEFVIKAEGIVAKRPQGNENKNNPTGEVEIIPSALEIISQSSELPFDLGEHAQAGEEIRLKYRYLDIRRKNISQNLVLRGKVANIIRSYLCERQFNEIETPILTKSTPEGARDYLVPCRTNPGTFYALPQSPQVFKQILMVAGMDRYFQLARNFRDEDLRSDRQPEHTQIDMEMSFAGEKDVAEAVEGMMEKIFSFLGEKIERPFLELEYKDAMSLYGSDKPDLRYDIKFENVTSIFKNSSFKVFSDVISSNGEIRAIKAKASAQIYSRGETDKLTDILKKNGAKGLAFFKIKEGKPEGGAGKFISGEEFSALSSLLNLQEGDTVFLIADFPENLNKYAGILRNSIIEKIKPPVLKKRAFLWVRHFPLLEKDCESGNWTFTHNPFTAPLKEHLNMLDTDPGEVLSYQYDLVLNGVELGSGSVRNHDIKIQEKIFSLMGYSKEEMYFRFPMILNALKYGAPPHAGIGIGFDRLMGIICSTDSIRDVIAFPKTTSGACLMTESPSPVSEKQLKELGISVIKK